MDRAAVIVSFDGPATRDGRIDVRDLAPALLAIGNLIDAANLATYGEKHPIKIEAKATALGSFEVVLEAVKSNWDLIASLIDTSGAQHAKALLEWLGLLGVPACPLTLVAVYRFLQGRRPDRVARAENNQFLLEIDGRTIVVPLEVMRLYQDLAVNDAFDKLLNVIEDDKVDKITFRDEAAKKGDLSLTLSKSDRQSFLRNERPPEIVLSDIRKMALSIRSLAFQEGNKWRLFDGQNTITAMIDDPAFLDRVDRNLIRFARDDVLMCDVKTVQTQGKGGLKTEHTVVRVTEHRQAPTQMALRLSDFDNQTLL